MPPFSMSSHCFSSVSITVCGRLGVFMQHPYSGPPRCFPKPTSLVNGRGSVCQPSWSCPMVQSNVLRIVEEDEVPAVHLKNMLGRTAWVIPATGEAAFTQGTECTWWVMWKDGDILCVPQGDLMLGENGQCFELCDANCYIMWLVPHYWGCYLPYQWFAAILLFRFFISESGFSQMCGSQKAKM